MGCLMTACLPSSQAPHLVLSAEREASRRLVARAFPQLVDLVDNGSLLVLQRSPGNGKDRIDGFQEPLLLFLLGTSHFSKASAVHVHRVVTAVRPQSVVVELCRSRAGLLNELPDLNARTTSAPNLLSMSGKGFISALSHSMRIGGQSAMTFRFLLALVSDKFSSVTGMAAGEEFRAAHKVAAAVNAQVVLGDRPIEITLRRAWEALDWSHKWRLIILLLRFVGSSKLDLSQENLQSLRSDDALSLMFNHLSKEFPALIQPLIHERDRYLAWSLTRSKAVNGSLRVVGVVGQGHMKGIVHLLKDERQTLSFRDVAGLQDNLAKQNADKQMRQLFARLVAETVLGIFLWLAFKNWYSDGDVGIFRNLFER